MGFPSPGIKVDDACDLGISAVCTGDEIHTNPDLHGNSLQTLIVVSARHLPRGLWKSCLYL